MARLLCVALVVTCIGCADRRVPAPDTLALDLTRAERLLDSGCYTCLQEAYGILAPHTSRSEPAARRAFAAALLLAMREKELGLEARPWIDKASALANADERPYLDVASDLPWAHAGVPEYEPATRPSNAMFERWKVLLLAPGTQPLVRDYLALATECQSRGRLSEDAARPADERPWPPLVRFRAGICGPDQRRHLEAVLAATPEFAEAAFYLARHEATTAYQNRDWARRAFPLLERAHTVLPQSPVIALALADLFRARRELPNALALYDDTLERRPTNRDALLGRTIVLSTLQRTDEAIATATRMLELGTWYMGDAYYWRAWNLYDRRDLERAAADIADAKKLRRNSDVFTLSGMIAFDQTRRIEAEADFTEAYRFDRENCTAAWYLGLITYGAARWVETSGRFVDAATCYERAAEAARLERADLPSDLSTAARDAQLAELGRRIDDAVLQSARAWLNAAQANGRLGQRSLGVEHAKRAAAHQDLKARADELIAALERP